VPSVRPAKVNPSMLDVARHAGVSIATVSNVVNRPEKVTEATAERVRAAIAELGFVRNDAARSLATGTNRSLGMVLADLDNSLFVDMAHGAQQSSDEAGLRLVLGNAACDIGRQENYLDLFDEARVAGVLLAPMEDSRVGIERMRAHGRAIVLLNYVQEGSDCCTVLVDNEMVGYLAARHLIDQGRRRIAFVAGREYYQPVQARRVGVQRAVAEAEGVELEEIHTTGLVFADGEWVASMLAERAPEQVPDGVVAVTDELANGLIEAVVLAGRFRVPADMAVVGCEDNRSARGGPVALTTVQLAGSEMGETAAELLLEELSGGAEHEHRTVTLPPRLVVRASSGAGELAHTGPS
jgi:LacI family transcriptional regulator